MTSITGPIDARDAGGMIVHNGTIQRFGGAAVSIDFNSHAEDLPIEVCNSSLC